MLDETPRQRNAVGVEVHHIEVVSAAACVDSLGERPPVRQSAGQDDGVRVGLLDGRIGELQHLGVVLPSLAERDLGLDARAEKVGEPHIHLVPQFPVADVRVSFRHEGHEAGEPLVAIDSLGKAAAGGVAMDYDLGNEAVFLVKLDQPIPGLQCGFIILARLAGLLDGIPVHGLSDEADIVDVEVVGNFLVEPVHTDAELGPAC